MMAEMAFENFATAKGWEVEKASFVDDINKHIDYYVFNPLLTKRRGFDIKKSSSPNEMWIEYTNVNGNDGWLRGQSDCIAFYLDDTDRRFLVVDRDELLDFWESVVDPVVTDDKRQAYLRAYQRDGRKDLIAKVKEDDIKALVTTRTWVI